MDCDVLVLDTCKFKLVEIAELYCVSKLHSPKLSPPGTPGKPVVTIRLTLELTLFSLKN